MIRQGDVLLIPVKAAPATARVQESRVVAPGNHGHDHRLEGKADLLESGPELYVKVESSARLTHAEHAHIALPAGIYRVRRQRQYHPLRHRPVPD